METALESSRASHNRQPSKKKHKDKVERLEDKIKKESVRLDARNNFFEGLTYLYVKTLMFPEEKNGNQTSSPSQTNTPTQQTATESKKSSTKKNTASFQTASSSGSSAPAVDDRVVTSVT